jgi:hypothetical protein
VARLGLSQWLVPDAVVGAVTEIAPQALVARGLRGLVIDLDNTLTRWNEPGCAPDVAAWLEAAAAAGLRLCIVSNNGPARVAAFCRGLGVDLPWIAPAGKPRPEAYRRALERLGLPPEHVAAVGDQIFTDVFGGKRAGLMAILVRPLARREFPATRVVRVIESWWLARLRRRGALRPL